MTDFRRVAAVTIDPGAAIDTANRKMIENGIRLLLVVEPNEGDACQAVRGLFSASQIARQLGVPVHVGDVVRTFTEIETSLNH